MSATPIQFFSSFHSGAVFDKNHEERARILRYAVQMANHNILRNSGIVLDSNVQEVSYGNTFAVSRSICSLMNVSTKWIRTPNRNRMIQSIPVSSRCYLWARMGTGSYARHEHLRHERNSVRGDAVRRRGCSKAGGREYVPKSRYALSYSRRYHQSVRMENIHHSVSVAGMAATNLSTAWVE